MGRDMRLHPAAEQFEGGVLDLAPRLARRDEARRELRQRLPDPRPRGGIERRRLLDAGACERGDDLRQPLGVAAEQVRPCEPRQGRAREELARQLQDDLLDARGVQDEVGPGRVVDDPASGRQGLEAVALAQAGRAGDLEQELDRVDAMAAVDHMVPEHAMGGGLDAADPAGAEARGGEARAVRPLAHEALPDIVEQAPGDAAEIVLVAHDIVGCGEGGHRWSRRFPLMPLGHDLSLVCEEYARLYCGASRADFWPISC